MCFQVLFDYDGEGEDELTLKRGEKIVLLSEDASISGDDGWWIGQIGEKVREPIAGLGSLLIVNVVDIVVASVCQENGFVYHSLRRITLRRRGRSALKVIAAAAWFRVTRV